MNDITRVQIDEMPTKSKNAIYHFPGGGGLLWCVATSEDLTLDLPQQAENALGVIDRYLKSYGLDRSRIVRAEVIVTDHGRKPEFDAVWAKWMPEGKGPVRSFVQSVMPDGDQVEIIMTVALPADFKG
ncbi:MAG TPA: Rid family hydrolase [Kaistia sp.]|nr:Rid family hydrolase [Kaistia sp.]